jgi:lipoprotein NlpI
MQKYPESVQDFLQAQSLHPDMPAKFHVKLGNAYMRTEAYDKALTEFQTYLRLDPKGQYAPAAQKVVDMMVKDGVTAAAASPPRTSPAPKP